MIYTTMIYTYFQNKKASLSHVRTYRVLASSMVLNAAMPPLAITGWMVDESCHSVPYTLNKTRSPLPGQSASMLTP